MTSPKPQSGEINTPIEPVVVATEEITTTPRTSPAENYSADMLESALIDVDDVLSRCSVPYIVIGETARQLKTNEKLHGEGIDIGVRRNEMRDEVKRTIKQFQPELDVDADYMVYHWMGTPVRITILDPEDRFFLNPDITWHDAWEYRTPNPWKEYVETL